MRCIWICLIWPKTCTGTTARRGHPTRWLLLTTASLHSSAPPQTWGQHKHPYYILGPPPPPPAISPSHPHIATGYGRIWLYQNWLFSFNIFFRLSDILQFDETNVSDSCQQQPDPVVTFRQDSVINLTEHQLVSRLLAPVLEETDLQRWDTTDCTFHENIFMFVGSGSGPSTTECSGASWPSTSSTNI